MSDEELEKILFKHLGPLGYTKLMPAVLRLGVLAAMRDASLMRVVRVEEREVS